RIVDALKVERSLTYNPLFQVMFAYTAGGRTFSGEALRLDNLETSSIEMATTSSKFDLSLDVFEDTVENVLYCDFEYSTELFDSATIVNFARRFEKLLRCIAHDS